MDPKKKKIYIIVIAICGILTISVFGWSKFQTVAPSIHTDGSDPNAVLPQNNLAPSGDATTGYSAPAIFPISKVFNTQVLDSSRFKNLQPYPPVDTAGQLGRVDPFRNY